MIFTRRFAVSLVVLLALVVLSASVVFAADMFSGMWKVNIAKSTFNPGPPPKGPNTVKVTAVSNGLSVVTDGVNSTGQKTHSEFTVKFDGKDYPNKATLDGKPNPNAADTISAKKIDDYTMELTSKLKGKVTATQKVVVSKDGKTQTGSQTGTNAQGQAVNNTIVYEKQ